jgi:hypothetical protein
MTSWQKVQYIRGIRLVLVELSIGLFLLIVKVSWLDSSSAVFFPFTLQQLFLVHYFLLEVSVSFSTNFRLLINFFVVRVVLLLRISAWRSRRDVSVLKVLYFFGIYLHPPSFHMQLVLIIAKFWSLGLVVKSPRLFKHRFFSYFDLFMFVFVFFLILAVTVTLSEVFGLSCNVFDEFVRVGLDDVAVLVRFDHIVYAFEALLLL